MLDTNFIIHYLANREDCISIFKSIVLESPVIFVSAVTVSELFAFDGLSKADIIEIELFLKEMNIINVDYYIG